MSCQSAPGRVLNSAGHQCPAVLPSVPDSAASNAA
ncbi:unnamed protein product, partial [Staurois parvus]